MYQFQLGLLKCSPCSELIDHEMSEGFILVNSKLSIYPLVLNAIVFSPISFMTKKKESLHVYTHGFKLLV